MRELSLFRKQFSFFFQNLHWNTNSLTKFHNQMIIEWVPCNYISQFFSMQISNLTSLQNRAFIWYFNSSMVTFLQNDSRIFWWIFWHFFLQKVMVGIGFFDWKCQYFHNVHTSVFKNIFIICIWQVIMIWFNGIKFGLTFIFDSSFVVIFIFFIEYFIYKFFLWDGFFKNGKK